MSNPKNLQDYSSLIGQRVEIYWNLHKHCFSLRKNGRVVCHTHRAMVFEVDFAVRKAGREKVRLEKRKNVHAFVRGRLGHFDSPLALTLANGLDGIQVSYDPFKNESFVLPKSNTPIFQAYNCLLRTLETVDFLGKPVHKPRLYI